MSRRLGLAALALAAVVSGCGEVRSDRGDGAASATARQGVGEGPISEVPTNGAFGPDQLSPSHN